MNANLDKTGLIYDERMVEHHCLFDPNYPECPERFSYSLQRCRDYGLVDRCNILTSRAATDEELLSQHSSNLIKNVKSTDNNDDEEYLSKLSSKYDAIYFHPSTYQLALLSVGCAIDLVSQIAEKKLKNGMAIIRPPGHHAMVDKACGYCFFNNVAIAAKHALDKLGTQRILIVDWDVHHGQATQYAFYDDPRVLYFSIHRYEHGSFWPELRESDYDYVGQGKGKGFNINVPLNKIGMGDAEYLAIFQQILLPVAHEFSPELVIISAGYDAAVGCIEFNPNLVLISAGYDSALGDPKGQMEVTPVGYAHMTSLLMTLASGKVAAILEGGYCLKSLSESVALTLRTLLGDPCPLLQPMKEPDSSVVETIMNVISVHRLYWNCFKLRFTDGESNSSNGFPDHVPTLKYLGHPPAENFEFPVTGFYPTQTPEEIARFDSRIDQLIAETNLSFPSNRTCIAYDDSMILHRNHQEFSHPERPERYTAIIKVLREQNLLEKCIKLKPRKAEDSEVLLNHGSDFLKEIQQSVQMKNRERCRFADKFRSIYLCDESYSSALTAVGSVLQIVDEVLTEKCRNGIAVVRPPGHHSEKDEACGFCLFNNVAIAAKYALFKYNLSRILIVDWDIHHGNGIQNSFYDDPRVLYISIHRYNNGTFFPSSTDANYNFFGKGDGAGYNINIPWNSVGANDGDYMSVFHQIILPIAYQFSPQLVLVSAGFDAAKGDPLGYCKVSPEGFGHMTQMLSGLASGKMILALEGGYNLNALSTSFAMCVRTLLGESPPSLPSETTACSTAAKSIRDVISVHKQFWSCLKFQVNLPGIESSELEGAVGGDSHAQDDIATLLLSLQLEDEEASGPFAVVPKTDCSHLEMISSFPEDSLNFSKLECSDCQTLKENWICLTCYKVFCGRYVNSHMLNHFEAADHSIAFSSCDFSVWCYKCESYIDDDRVLGFIKERAQYLKFGI